MRKLYSTLMSAMLLSAVILLTTGCAPDEPDQWSPKHREINNDLEELNKRLTPRNDTIEIISSENGGRKVSHFALILKGELLPPQIEGNLLQATSLYYHWGNFLVSYNYRGEEYFGAVDFVSPELNVQSQILFTDADIHAVTAHDRYAYLMGAMEGAESPAYVEKVLLDGMQFSLQDNTYKHLGSFAANSAMQFQGNIFVTTGDDETNGGGVYKLDRDLNIQGFLPLHDARWMSGTGNDLYIAQGTPGTVSLMSSNKMEFEESYSFDGANVPEAKTTIEVADKRIFIAAGSSGVVVLDQKDGSLLHTLTFEDETCVTNAVSAENGLLFISNGEGGAYVAIYDQGKVSEVPEVLGKIAFEENVSVNHILFRNYKLWVASGSGGVKMVDIEIW